MIAKPTLYCHLRHVISNTIMRLLLPYKHMTISHAKIHSQSINSKGTQYDSPIQVID